MVSFSNDISSLFRPKDISSMIAFRLLQGVGAGSCPKVTSRIARMSYGTVIHKRFLNGTHLPEDKEWIDGYGFRATNQMEWLVRKVGPHQPTYSWIFRC